MRKFEIFQFGVVVDLKEPEGRQRAETKNSGSKIPEKNLWNQSKMLNLRHRFRMRAPRMVLAYKHLIMRD